MTMASRWSHNPRSSSRASNNPSTFSDTTFASQGKQSRQASSEHSVPPPAFQDPLPLDDNCAKYVLSVMVLFLRQTAPPEYPLMRATSFADLTFRDFESPQPTTAIAPDDVQEPPPYRLLRSRESALHTQASSNSVKSGKLSVNSTIQIPTMKAAYEKTHMSLVKSSLPVNTLIAKYAGRIVFHISASNWNAVYLRLRTKIHFLASNSVESPDITDLQLMAHSALDRQRLVQLLNGALPSGLCL